MPGEVFEENDITRISHNHPGIKRFRSQRTAIYARISTDEGYGLEVQRGRLRNAARARGCEVVAEYEDRCSGDGSGLGIQALLQDAAEGKFQTVMVTEIDRITRSLPDFYCLHDVLETLGVGIISIDGSLDTTTAQGRVFLKMILMFAELERVQTGGQHDSSGA